MKISRKDALTWFRFFAELPEDRFFAELPEEEPLGCRQQEIALAVFSQIETAVEARRKETLLTIPGLKAVVPGTEYAFPWSPDTPACTLFVGPEVRFPGGCRSCLLGTGLSAVRKTNRCNLACPFCYDYGQLDCIEPIGEDLWEIGGSRYREEDCSSPCRKSPRASPMSIWNPLWRSRSITGSSGASARRGFTSTCIPTA